MRILRRGDSDWRVTATSQIPSNSDAIDLRHSKSNVGTLDFPGLAGTCRDTWQTHSSTLNYAHVYECDISTDHYGANRPDGIRN